MASSVTRNVVKKQRGLQVFRIFYLWKRFLFDCSSCHGAHRLPLHRREPRSRTAPLACAPDLHADGDFRIEADVSLDATQEEGEVIFKNYRVGFVEDLAE